MDLQTISQTFFNILSGNQELIKQGTQFIENSRSLPQFTLLLIELSIMNNVNINIRQFALTTLQQTVEKMWIPKMNKPTIPIEDKQIIKAQMLPNIIIAAEHRELYKQFEKIISNIQNNDNQPIDPQVLAQIVQILTCSDDYKTILGCLLYLKSFFKVYEYALKDDRSSLEIVVNQTFDSIQILSSKIIQSYTIQTAMLLNQILKIFNICTHIEFPDLLKDNETLIRNWLDFFKMIMELNVSPQNKQFPQNQQQEMQIIKSPEWKNKKQTGKILMRFIQKFANKKLDKSKFPDIFLDNYSLIFLDIAFKTLYLCKQQYVSVQVFHYEMRFIYFSMRYPEIVLKMTPQFEKLLIEVCIPALTLQQKDIEMWETDPQEFIRKEEDFSQLIHNPKNSTMDVIDLICKHKAEDGETFLHKLMKYFFISLQTEKFPNSDKQITPQQLDGVLWCIQKLYQQIIADKQLQSSIEDLLQQFVLPLFDSPFQYLVGRACTLYGEFNNITYKNKQTICTVTQKLKLCIFQQNEALRLKAAISLNFMLKQQEAIDLLRPDLPSILKIYLQIIEIVENEAVVASLKGIIENFSKEITPFAVELCETLKNQFTKLCNKEKMASDDSNCGEAEMAAAGIGGFNLFQRSKNLENFNQSHVLNAIIQILKSPLDVPVYDQLFQILQSVIDIGISDDQTEYIDETLDMLCVFLQKQNKVHPSQWFYFSVIVYLGVGLEKNIRHDFPNLDENQISVLEGVQNGWGLEFSDRIIKVIKNFFLKDAKSSPQIMTTHVSFNQISYIEEMNSLINKACVVCSQSTDDVEMTNYMQIWTAFIENYASPAITKGTNHGKNNKIQTFFLEIQPVVKNEINHILTQIPKILEQNQDKTDRFKIACFGILSLCFYVDAAGTMQHCVQQQSNGGLSLKKYFQEWLAIGDMTKKEYDLQRFMLGFSAIFNLQQQQIPQELEQLIPQILKKIAQLTSQILEVRFEDDDEDEEELEDGQKEEDYLDEADDYMYAAYGQSYDSPLENLDEIIYFSDVLQSLKNTNQNFFAQLIGLLTPDEQNKLDKNINQAKQDFEQYLKNKQTQNQK